MCMSVFGIIRATVSNDFTDRDRGHLRLRYIHVDMFVFDEITGQSELITEVIDDGFYKLIDTRSLAEVNKSSSLYLMLDLFQERFCLLFPLPKYS